MLNLGFKVLKGFKEEKCPKGPDRPARFESPAEFSNFSVVAKEYTEEHQNVYFYLRYNFIVL